ncbi:uncharacterized protein PGTG_02407 [Puccinia graminis f. sp. tritici CRL 75-36-700-3]|uniref:Uncharacterized protein n=1 Tax=Puccinia graminis f. sp. tritici (strain CRL 75-36-700-3 / race SCCL) TaxID=418459 RepID=E3JY21_PUCGT|nr:uncharacterized protein PGTG_02407 [Puccinia graminis f. sp. tritici CRL 75-36-700-3]EFP76946.2 hypothetical protein PGTG_02407 [Puccinia graminis f. sp. tritici CRL 75-36-700-3]
MQLRIITPGPSSQLPEELLTHRVDHSVDVFHKKSRPYAKISVPPGYTENQALCQQFGISPHSLLCMEPALWRQQIVDQVIFDLSKECIQINLINGSSSLYSFAECQQIFDQHAGLQPKSSPASRKSTLYSKIKPVLLSHLDPLISRIQHNSHTAADLKQLCRMSSYQLAILKKKARPHLLTPTIVQVALDERRAKQEKAKPTLPKKNTVRKKTSSILGASSKNRKLRIKSAPTPENENPPSALPDFTSTFQLEAADLHQLAYHLSAYRSTLVDFFQSAVLPILRAELPQLYSLWVLESQIQLQRESFQEHSLQLANILHENHALENFQRLHSTRYQSDLLRDLKEWCQAATVAHSCEQELSSADTSLNEPFPIHQTVLKSPLSSPRGLISRADTMSKDAKTFSQSTLRTLPVTSIWPVISTSPSAPLSNNLDAESRVHVDSNRFSRERTPSLSPPSKVLSQSRFPPHSILDLPFLILEQGFLLSIKSEKQRQLAIEIGIKLAEERLEIEKLNESFLILKLLEEERDARDQFSGISRLSDIITTSRLSAGLHGSEANIAQHATIKGALAGSKPIPVDGSGANADTSPKTSYRPPSKSSELKRRQCIKRKTWLAATRRLDCRLVGQDQHAHEMQVWPEPIFLKNSNRKRRKDRNGSETGSSSVSEDGLRSSETKRRKRGGELIGEIVEIAQDGKRGDNAQDFGQLAWVKLATNNSDPGTSDRILVSAPISASGSIGMTVDSATRSATNWLVNQEVIAELPHPIDDDGPSSPGSKTLDQTSSVGERSEELTMENLKLFTQNDKVFESLTGECSNGNQSEVDSDWPR